MIAFIIAQKDGEFLVDTTFMLFDIDKQDIHRQHSVPAKYVEDVGMISVCQYSHSHEYRKGVNPKDPVYNITKYAVAI